MMLREMTEPNANATLSEAQLRNCYTLMMNKLLDTNLLPEQKKKANFQETSIFNAYFHRACGGEHVVMAL